MLAFHTHLSAASPVQTSCPSPPSPAGEYLSRMPRDCGKGNQIPFSQAVLLLGGPCGDDGGGEGGGGGGKP